MDWRFCHLWFLWSSKVFWSGLWMVQCHLSWQSNAHFFLSNFTRTSSIQDKKRISRTLSLIGCLNHNKIDSMKTYGRLLSVKFASKRSVLHLSSLFRCCPFIVSRLIQNSAQALWKIDESLWIGVNSFIWVFAFSLVSVFQHSDIVAVVFSFPNKRFWMLWSVFLSQQLLSRNLNLRISGMWSFWKYKRKIGHRSTLLSQLIPTFFLNCIPNVRVLS